MSRADEQLMSPDITNDGEFLHHLSVVLDIKKSHYLLVLVALAVITSEHYMCLSHLLFCIQYGIIPSGVYRKCFLLKFRSSNP